MTLRMSVRWIVAAAAALTFALIYVGAAIPRLSLGTGSVAGAAASGVCEASPNPVRPNFTLKNMENSDIRLSDFKGKVVLLNFWATWCGPCKMEIPLFVEFQSKYGKDGLQMIGISIDDTLEKLQPFVAQLKMNYPVLQGRGREDVQDLFGPMYGIPTTIVIARDGTICRRHVGVSTRETFEREIKSLL